MPSEHESVAAAQTAFDARRSDLLRDAVDGTNEAVRQRVWAAVGTSLRDRHQRVTTTPTETWVDADICEAVLALGAGPPDALRTLGGFVFTVLPEDELHRILHQRPKAWRAAFAAEVLGRWAREREVGLFGPFWTESWLTLRGAVRAGILPPEPHDEYLLLMVRGLTFSGDIERELEADPELLQSEVWELFDAGPGVQRALGGGDRYFDPANAWGPSLVRLARRGLIDESNLRRYAESAAADEKHAPGHRRWFARLVRLIDEPGELAPPSGTRGAPPPGNRLRRVR